jgi:hypothetical protein
MLVEVSSFKMTESPIAQRWLRDHIFGKLEVLQKVLLGNVELTLFLGISWTFLVLFLLIKLNILPSLVDIIKRKVMYSSIFRG